MARMGSAHARKGRRPQTRDVAAGAAKSSVEGEGLACEEANGVEAFDVGQSGRVDEANAEAIEPFSLRPVRMADQSASRRKPEEAVEEAVGLVGVRDEGLEEPWDIRGLGNKGAAVSFDERGKDGVLR